MNLYQISQECEERLIKLGEMLENGDTPSDDEVNALLDLQGNLTDKLVNYGKFIKNNTGDIDALDSEIKRLTAKKRALNNLNDRLKSSMMMAMQANNIDKVDDPITAIAIQKSPVSVRLDIDPTHLPLEFQKVKVEADKASLLNALKTGEVIDGAVLEQNYHIRIK